MFEQTRIQLDHLFAGRGFPSGLIDLCVENFGVSAIDVIKRNPFTLLVRGFPGCGFIRVNQLYESMGLAGRAHESRKREVIYLWHAIKEGDGSVWYDSRVLCQNLARTISTKTNPRRAIAIGVRAGWLVQRRDKEGVLWLSTAEESGIERRLTEKLVAMIADIEGPPPETKPEFGDWILEHEEEFSGKAGVGVRS